MSDTSDSAVRILAVPGTSTTGYLLKQAFEPDPYRLDVRENTSPEALQSSVEQHPPHTLFLSSTLRDFDSFTFCREIKRSDAIDPVRVIFIASNSEKQEVALEHGADGFLGLPFSPSEARRLTPDPDNRDHRLLYVEDSDYVHAEIVPQLEEEGYSVTEAWNGREGWKAFRERDDIDLVISDIEMPEMNGYELCERLRDNSSIPVILASSLDRDENIQQGLETGANDYITKPIVFSELIHRVERLLGLRRENRPETILSVDDSDMMRNNIAQFLEDQGFTAVKATNGEEALRKVETRDFDLVVTDYEMPIMNGYELARELRVHHDRVELPIVVLSSRDSEADLVRMRSAGVQAVLTKPFDGDRLNAEVERVLGESRLEKQKRAMRHYVSDETLDAVQRLSDSTGDQDYYADNKERTIFFVDIVGFTELCENLSPADVVDLLNTYFDEIVRILVDYDATIDKFIGDAVLALFDSDEDGAYKAVTSGLEIIEATENLRDQLELDLRVRVGINTGPVIVGDLGSKHERRDFTVVGDSVNVAQRLEEHAGPDELVISGSTRELLNGRVETEQKESIRPRGKTENVDIYRVNHRTSDD